MKLSLLVANLLLSAAFLCAAGKTPESMLGAALHQEEVQGDLKGAIAAYQKVLAAPGVSRKTAAEALVRMGQCYEKLGNAESRKVYERVLREYADQKEAVATARVRLGENATARGAGISVRQVWTLPPKGDIFGTVSPDGRYVPYVAWAEYGDLFLHDLVTGTDRRLTNTANDGKPGVGKSQEQYAEEYAFSKNGKQLVYSWFTGDRYELRVVDLQGSGVPVFRKLFSNEDVDWIGPCDWSSDGKWISVQLKRKDKTAQLGLVSASDGSLRVLKSVDWRGATGAFFSADSKYVAYDLPATETSQQRDIFVLSIDGSREIPAVLHPGEDAVLGWSPDGKRLLFASDRSGSMSLWALRVGDGKPDGPPELLKNDIGQIRNMGVSGSGSLYFYSHTAPGTDIQMGSFDFEKGDFLTPPVQAVATYVGSNQSPDWSPDGKNLAFFSRRRSAASSYFVIGIRSVQTGQIREVMPLPNFDLFWSLTWSRDGNSFLAGGRDVKGRNGIFRIDAQNGRTSLIIEGARASGAAAESPEGTSLYYSAWESDGLEVAFIKRNLASAEETVLFKRANLDRSLNLSPDGRYLAVHALDPSTRMPTAILLVPTTGGESRELVRVSAPQRTSFFAWIPGSTAMLARKFISQGNMEQWRIPLDGGEPKQLEAKARFPSPGFRVHPDGKQVAFLLAKQRKPTEIWTLENFLPTLKASK
ncbi:MAG TPA: tetratricopeptide repeat protein [Bryobacteraceae bacterium]|nr:tetratricopeptide repeat protein [Bryobacteraceae bacterium]